MVKIETKYKSPSECAGKIGYDYASLTYSEHKKKNGQFLTPIISDFMGNLAQLKKSGISILDPGCGTAILSCSLIEKLAQNS